MSARILVVDDIPANVRLLEAKLSSEYYDVIPATGGEEALVRARADQPDIILLDVMMPGMDGFECCRQLKVDPATRHIPVVMVTALDQREDRIKGLAVGAEDFLTKPIDDVQLMARVRSLAKMKLVLDELRSREASGRRIGVIEQSAWRDVGAGGRVLIIDDNARQSEKIRNALGQEHVVQLMGDPNARNGGLDLMVISLASQAFDGLKLIARMRAGEGTRQLPILAVVDPEDKGRAVRALDLGANDLVLRPVDAEELQVRVRSLIRGRRYVEAMRSSVDQGMEMAVTDQLTGLFNRRYLMGQLIPLAQRASRGGEPVSVLVADIDYFKRINDGFGHDAGDAVLKEFAARLATNFRPVDVAARFGGEEFVVAMPDTRGDDAALVAERLRRHVAGAPFIAPATRERIDVTVSVGVATSSGPDDTAETLIKRADQALYRAKSGGRNRVVAEAA
jgi:two-component system cell cycle response regulator